MSVGEVDYPLEAGAPGAKPFDVAVKAPGVVLGLSTVDEVIGRIPIQSAPSLRIGHGGTPVIRVHAFSAAQARAVVATAVAESGRCDVHVVAVLEGPSEDRQPAPPWNTLLMRSRNDPSMNERNRNQGAE